MYDDAPLELWALDDVVQKNIADNIDLIEDWDDEEPQAKSGSSNLTVQQRAAARFAFSLGSTASAASFAATSMDVPSLDNPRINGSDFRMNSCLLAPSGALMLPTSLDLFSSASSSTGLPQRSTLIQMASLPPTEVAASSAPQQPEDFDWRLQNFSPHGGDNGPFDSGNHHDTNDLATNDNYEYNTGNELMREPMMDMDDDDDNLSGVTWSAGGIVSMSGQESSGTASNNLDLRQDKENARPNTKGAKNGLNEADQQVLRALVDPWRMHDPHDQGSATKRPFKKGKTYKLPKKTTATAEPSPKIASLDHLVAGVSLLDLNYGLNRPFFPEFDYIFDEEVKKTRAERLRKRKTAIAATAAQAGLFVDESTLLLADDTEHDASTLDADLRAGNDMHKDQKTSATDELPDLRELDGGGGGYWSDNDDIDYSDNHGLDRDASGAFGDMRDQLKSVADNGAEGADEPYQTYEDHLKAKFEEYLNSTKQAMMESELSARIDEWSAKLTPLLTLQESRPPFDIHAYGERLIGLFPEKDQLEEVQARGDTVSAKFSDLFTDTPAYEVCRSFSSMLQLANMGNIKIVPARDADGLHDITLELLTTQPGVDIDSFAASGSNGIADEFATLEPPPPRSKAKAKVTRAAKASSSTASRSKSKR